MSYSEMVFIKNTIIHFPLHEVLAGNKNSLKVMEKQILLYAHNVNFIDFI